ncbi:molybdopterin-guanine dinucleotide biosynthesis protein B [Nguyenibacter sp. L1]|uniref:molybdopterin-guanine dinucleotide biosynthesis protein B n=1 Tax=Nguyenibacter sp. L1 TaxID=3049350 RepID=UPI002B4A41B6|nr:molybdopterin-guanine dinucleotide biosynthesis protein B [Nguyenibacter sp. L1]WRH86975.1 molybdopterin-guanine dinucleotide biosynthesis protein B [Nguyenibacter sp. L1]
MHAPAIMGITGRSGAGKTTLIERLLTVLGRRGVRVSTIKHAHHGFDIDRPGKDSWRHRAAGAREVLVASGTRWALLHEAPDEEAESGLPELIGRMGPADLILVEGFRGAMPAAIEVYRPSLSQALPGAPSGALSEDAAGKEPLWPVTPQVLAVATDDAALALPPGIARLDLADAAAIGDFVMARARPWRPGAGAA